MRKPNTIQRKFMRYDASASKIIKIWLPEHLIVTIAINFYQILLVAYEICVKTVYWATNVTITFIATLDQLDAKKFNIQRDITRFILHVSTYTGHQLIILFETLTNFLSRKLGNSLATQSLTMAAMLAWPKNSFLQNIL